MTFLLCGTLISSLLTSRQNLCFLWGSKTSVSQLNLILYILTKRHTKHISILTTENIVPYNIIFLLYLFILISRFQYFVLCTSLWVHPQYMTLQLSQDRAFRFPDSALFITHNMLKNGKFQVKT